MLEWAALLYIPLICWVYIRLNAYKDYTERKRNGKNIPRQKEGTKQEQNWKY